MAIIHIQSLADGDAADQLFYLNKHGSSAIMRACPNDAPLELVQLMITKAKLDSRKRCLLAIASNYVRNTALHYGYRMLSYGSPPVLRSLPCITPSRRVRKVSRSSHASPVTSSFRISSMKACTMNKKRVGERLSPCFTPVQEAKDSVARRMEVVVVVNAIVE